MNNYRDPEIYNWIHGQKLKNSKGEPFEWYKHKFLVEPLCDMHPRQGINKSAQVGWSELTIIKCLYLAKEKKLNIIYTLPTDQFLEKFVPPKVNPIIDYNVPFQNITGGQSLKRVPVTLPDGMKAERYIYFMGTFSSKAKTSQEESSKGISVTADLLVHDEASRSDGFIISQLTSRVENSDYGGRWLFDNPTYPNMGSDYLFQRSDKRYWIVRCRRCGHRQWMDWYRLDEHEFRKGSNHCWVDPERGKFICGGCAKSLNEGDIIQGEWVATKPSITDTRGYWLNQLCYVQHNVPKIIAKEEDPKMPKSVFWNFVLGKPYVGSDVKIGRQNIINNLKGGVNLLENNYMGIDQGNKKHYVIGNAQGIFLTGSTDSWEEVEKLFNKYNCIAVSDALPYQQYPKYMAKKYPGRFFRAFYKPESDQAEIAKFKESNGDAVVLIRREEAFDMLVDKIMTGMHPITMSLFDLEEYIKHWGSLIRTIEEDDLGNQRFHWERIDDDHLAHCDLYHEIAKLLQPSTNSIVAGYNKQAETRREAIDMQNYGPEIEDLVEFFAPK